MVAAQGKMSRKQINLLEKLANYIGPLFVELSERDELAPEHALGLILVQFLEAGEAHPEWQHAVVEMYKNIGTSQLVSANALTRMLRVR